MASATAPQGRTGVLSGAASAELALITEITAIASFTIRTLRFAATTSPPHADALVHARHAPVTGKALLRMTKGAARRFKWTCAVRELVSGDELRSPLGVIERIRV
jgi:hypothetical protein